MFEKRKFIRLALQAVGKGKTLAKVFCGKEMECSVVDISLGGIRLRFLVDEDVDMKGKNIKMVLLDGRFEKTGEVRWQNGKEFGVQFNELLMPRELQNVLDELGF